MIGKQLKSLRKDNGYTQADLAKKLHLTPRKGGYFMKIDEEKITIEEITKNYFNDSEEGVVGYDE